MSTSKRLRLVKTLGELDGGTVDVIKQDQMQNNVLEQRQVQNNVLEQRQVQSVKLTGQFNSPTRPRLARAAKASLMKGQSEKIMAGTTKISSPRVEQNKIGPNKLSYRESNVSTKHVLSDDNGGTTDLRKLLTPIDLFEDECIFCHSFRTSQFHGPMVCYLKGRVLPIHEGNSSNAIYVHKKCLEWTPKVWIKDGIVINMESEIRRASRLRCRRCGLLGAALGCYYDRCPKSFHVPCALKIVDCRWDNEGHVLCPEHASMILPGDDQSTHTTENDNSSSSCQSQCSQNEESFTYFEEEDQQSDQLKTARSFLPVGQCTDKEGNFGDHHRDIQETDHILNASSLPQSPYIDKKVIFDNHQRKNQQTDQFNISNPSYLPQSSRDGQHIDQLDISSSPSCPLGQHSDDERISKDGERDDKRTHKHNTNLSSLPRSCHPDKGIFNACGVEEIKADQPDTSRHPSDQLVLLGLSLTASEKDSLQEFACSINATVTKEWAKNVTHVIVGKGAGSLWNRSFEVLMGILLGKWVVHFEWIAGLAVLPRQEMRPRPEASYEVAFSMDSLRTIYGPRKGRIRATKGAPNLFSGLRFCLSAYMNPDARNCMRDLIVAAEGRVMEGGDQEHSLPKNSEASSVKPYFVYDGDAPKKFDLSTVRKEVEEAKKHAAAGARVICHLTVLDAIAAYDAGILNAK